MNNLTLSLFDKNKPKTKTEAKTEYVSKLEKITSSETEIIDRTNFPFKSGVNMYLRSEREYIKCDMCKEMEFGKTYYYESGWSDTRLIICNNCKRRESRETK